jgi:hypothetical protein
MAQYAQVRILKKTEWFLNYIKKQAAGFASKGSAGGSSWRISPFESALKEITGNLVSN